MKWRINFLAPMEWAEGEANGKGSMRTSMAVPSDRARPLHFSLGS